MDKKIDIVQYIISNYKLINLMSDLNKLPKNYTYNDLLWYNLQPKESEYLMQRQLATYMAKAKLCKQLDEEDIENIINSTININYYTIEKLLHTLNYKLRNNYNNKNCIHGLLHIILMYSELINKKSYIQHI